MEFKNNKPFLYKIFNIKVQSQKFESGIKKNTCVFEKTKNEICENNLNVEILTSVLVRNKFFRPNCGLAPSETLKPVCI